MDYGPHRKYFEEADPFEIGALYGIVETKKGRNWNWLIEWIDGTCPLIMGAEATAKRVIEYYENDEIWNMERLWLRRSSLWLRWL
jgi:hypothetical protein